MDGHTNRKLAGWLAEQTEELMEGWMERWREGGHGHINCRRGRFLFGIMWRLNYTPESALSICELSQLYTCPLCGIQDTLCNL